MAEHSAQDVVDKVQSVGDSSPSDDTAAKNIHLSSTGGVEEESSQANFSDDVQHALDGNKPPVEESGTMAETGGLEAVIASESTDGGSVSSRVPQGESVDQAIKDAASAVEDFDTATSREASDSEVVRSELGDTASSDGKGHVRSGSTKKPTSFKAVSVTKSFLARAGSASSPSPKAGPEKTTPSSTSQANSPTPPIARPRLVAKSGASIRDMSPRKVSISSNSAKPGTPDGNQVWNKNRPAQPASSKNFTDEELKQQYGIHLATRLQADGAGKEAKWADIDDDDDEDWAPETIEWNDGTKITLPQHEEQPEVPLKDQLSLSKSPPITSERIKEIQRPAQAPLQDQDPNRNSNFSSPQVNGQVKGNSGLVLKGAPEKPTLVAKPLAPAPVRSPWAALPPVDRVSPVSHRPNQPPNQPAHPYTSSQPQGRDSFDHHGVQPSTREIAADDFNRGWRDTRRASRELYNSQSGRYEPVQERRGSMRSDQQFRQPSVLQRNALPESQNMAEPSPAFQTNRTSAQDGHWGRRRTSSNVSGGSGSFARRLSQSRPADSAIQLDSAPGQWRGHPAPQPFDRSPSPSKLRSEGPPHTHAQHHPSRDVISPSQDRAQQATSHHPADQEQLPNGAIETHPAEAPNPQESESAENPVEVQKKIMRDSMEQARRRRREQEMKEEAEKKERIRAKMESLGLPPLEEDKPKDGIRAGDKMDESPKAIHSHVEESRNKPQSIAQDQMKSPEVRPPVPATNEVVQYGVMKIHQPESVKKTQASPEQAQRNLQPRAPSSPRADRLEKSPLRQDPRAGTGSLATAMDTSPNRRNDIQRAGETKKTHVTQQQRPTRPAGSEAYPGWVSGGNVNGPAGNNLWGPPTNDKALGNGAFDHGFGTLASRSRPQGPQEAQAAGQASVGAVNAPIYQLSESFGNAQAPTGPAEATSAAFPRGGKVNSKNSQFGRGHNEASQAFRTGQGQVGDTQQTLGQQPAVGPLGRAGRGFDQHRNTALSAWKSFPTHVQKTESEERKKADAQRAARLEEQARTGTVPEFQRPVFNETWRQVVVDEESSTTRHLVDPSRTGPSKDLAAIRPVGVAPQQTTVDSLASGAKLNFPPPGPIGAGRGSRFFPQHGDATPPTQLQQSVVGAGSPSSSNEIHSSSPPPDSIEHPAYYGDAKHPQVSLPTPKPVVKLPPSMISQDAPQLPIEAATRTEQHLFKPSGAESWQERFNGLFKTSRGAGPASLSQNARNATVSVPIMDTLSKLAPLAKFRLVADTGDLTSKSTEEILFEEREFGSLPPVNLPRYEFRGHSLPMRLNHPKFRGKKGGKPATVVSKDAFDIDLGENTQVQVIEVRLPGNALVKSFTGTQRPDRPKPRSGGPQGSFKDKRKGFNKGQHNNTTNSPSSTAPKAPATHPSRPAPTPGSNWGRKAAGTA